MTWLRRTLSAANAPVLRFGLPASLLIAVTLLIRNGDGAIPWEKLSATLARWPTASYTVSILLLGALIATKWVARPVTRALCLLLPPALLWAAWVNASSFTEINESDQYRLRLRNSPTLLDIAEQSPSEYERTDIAFYLFMKRGLEGRRITSFDRGLLVEHNVRHVARVADYRIASYPHDLDAAAAQEIEALPHVSRHDGRGHTFVFLTDEPAVAARSFHIMQQADKYYLLPDPPPQSPEKH